MTRMLPQTESDIFLKSFVQIEKELDQTFDTSFFIGLSDHLHYAIERYSQGIPLNNPLAWEVRKFYPDEYKLAQVIIANINEALTIQLHNEEAASIALHLINAQKNNGKLSKHQKLTTLVFEILEIVRLQLALHYDKESVNYRRFETHIYYLGQRILNGEVQGKNDAFLFEQIKINYPKEFECMQKVVAFVNNNYHFEMSKDEQIYLTIHINRVREMIEKESH